MAEAGKICFFCALEYSKKHYGDVREAWTMYKGTPLCAAHVAKWQELNDQYMIHEDQ